MNLKDSAERRLKMTGSLNKKSRVKLISRMIKKGGSILDIGSAEGNFGVELKKQGYKYSGVDYNEYLVKQCLKRELRVKTCDVSREKIPFKKGAFDLVWCSHVIEHLNPREQIHLSEEISRVTKKGGIAIIFAPTPYHWYFWDEETHVRPCTHAQLSKHLRNFNFEIIKAKYTLTRFFPNSWQRFLRLPPLRWFLWETFVIAKKK